MEPDDTNNTQPGAAGRPEGAPLDAQERAHDLIVRRAVSGLSPDESAELLGLMDRLGMHDDPSSYSALDATIATVELAYGERVALTESQRLRLEGAAAAWAAVSRPQGGQSGQSGQGGRGGQAAAEAGAGLGDADDRPGVSAPELASATRERVLLLGEVYGDGPAPVAIGPRRRRVWVALGGTGWAAAACLGVALIIVTDRQGAASNAGRAVVAGGGAKPQLNATDASPDVPLHTLASAVLQERPEATGGDGRATGRLAAAPGAYELERLGERADREAAALLDDAALALNSPARGWGTAEADPLWAESPRPVYASAASLVTLVQAEPDRVLVPMHRPGEEAAPPVAYVIWSGDLQAGVLVVAALEPIDPPIDQYQLWIVDPTRESRYPVSGAVFSMPEHEASALVRVRPDVTVARPSAFVLTIERAGGVVVSRGDSVVAVGNTEPLGIASGVVASRAGAHSAVMHGPPEPEAARPAGAGADAATR